MSCSSSVDYDSCVTVFELLETDKSMHVSTEVSTT